jgi:type IX secretion system PorP/SprF family membrane protein
LHFHFFFGYLSFYLQTLPMKRILLVAALFCVAGTLKVSAQQEPRYTHFMYTTLSYNPAYAASKEAICAGILYHNQWTGFSSIDQGANSPITQTFNIMGLTPIGAKKGKVAGRMGAGLSIVNDKIGFASSTGIMVDLAYRFDHLVPFAEYVSIGLSGGFMQQALAPNYVFPDPNDPRIPGQSTSGTPDANAGIFMGSRNIWYAGASTTHFIKSKAKWKAMTGGEVELPIAPAYYLVGGYNRPLNSNFDLQTHGQLETDFAKYQLSLSAMALYKQKIYGGITGRFEKLTAISIMAGFYPSIKGNGSLLIAAAYDLPTGHASAFGGTPEIFARYCFNFTFRQVENVFPKDGRHL